MIKKTPVAALVAAEIVSILGSRMTYLALPWFVLVTTGSVAKMTLVLAAEMIPMALLGVPSGALVQRLGSRTTMLMSDLARAPLMASVPLLHAAGVLSFPLLLVIVFVLGAFMPPYFASQRTILPELVGEDERLMSQANSLIEGGTALAALLGPALAGILIPFLGAPNVLYVDGGTYIVSFLLVLTLVPLARRAAAPAQHGMLAGLRFVFEDALLAPLTVTLVLFGFLASGLSAALPYYAYATFHGSSRIAGLFYTALGGGAVVGSIFAVAAVKKVAPLKLAALAIMGVTLPLWALGLLPPAWAVFLVLFVATLFTPLVNGPVIAVMTGRMPLDLRAKAMTALISLNTLAGPAGFLVAGQVIAHSGIRAVFVAVAAGMTATALLFVAIVARQGRGYAVPHGAAVADD